MDQKKFQEPVDSDEGQGTNEGQWKGQNSIGQSSLMFSWVTPANIDLA